VCLGRPPPHSYTSYGIETILLFSTLSPPARSALHMAAIMFAAVDWWTHSWNSALNVAVGMNSVRSMAAFLARTLMISGFCVLESDPAALLARVVAVVCGFLGASSATVSKFFEGNFNDRSHCCLYLRYTFSVVCASTTCPNERVTVAGVQYVWRISYRTVLALLDLYAQHFFGKFP
jgi:hypothetical protein